MLFISLLNIGIFQGIILGIIILRSPLFKSKANKYLALAIFSLSLSLLNLVLDITKMYDEIPFLLVVDIIDSSVLFPVLIFLFVVHQIDHPIKDSSKNLWLFVPFLYSVLSSTFDELNILTHFYTLSNLKVFLLTLLNEIVELSLMVFFMPGILIYTHSFIKYSGSIQEKKWLIRLWLLAFIIMMSWLLTIFFSIMLNYDPAPVMRVIALFATFFIHWTAYSGIFKFRLAQDQEAIKALINKRKPNHTPQNITQAEPSKENDIEKTETLNKENPYFIKLEELCIKEQIYTDSTLDRDKVAEMLGISSGYVSQLVNTITGDNFSTYVNRYRVAAVKDIILDPEFDNYSLLAIGLECGFSSKTTFHNAFKKITGMTPNTYRKMHK